MKPSSASITNVPAFLTKLWKMVNDPETDNLICWSANGHNFVIQNEAQFWYKLLPIYYKHNNMSSFIRQLNMYGFHKVPELSGMENEKEEIKFFHPFFRREQPNLLKHIKRKISSSKINPASAEESKPENLEQISKVLVDVKQLRNRQESVDSQLIAMRQENAALWRELALLRQKHLKQQQIVNKLIQFLVTIVQPSRSTGISGLGVKRRFPLMIERDPKTPKTDISSDGPTIHELDSESTLQENIFLNESTKMIASSIENVGQVDSPQSVENFSQEPMVLLDVPLDSEDDTINPAILLNENQLNTDADILMPQDNPPEELISNSSIVLSNNDKLNSNLNEVLIGKDVMTANEFIDLNAFKTIANNKENLCSAQQTVNSADTVGSSLMCASKIKAEKSNYLDNLNMMVATRSSMQDCKFKLNSCEDLDNHLEATQGELDSIKDILFDGCSLDANALLGLFNLDENFPMEVPQMLLTSEDKKNVPSITESTSSELAKYSSPMLDFYNLFDESSDDIVDTAELDSSANVTNIDEQVNTPIIIKEEINFPKYRNSK